MKFYCVKCKKSFETEDYSEKTIKGRKFAVAKCPDCGTECYRIVGR